MNPADLPKEEQWRWVRENLSIVSWLERYYPDYARMLTRLNTPGVRFNGPCFHHQETKGNSLVVDEGTGRVVCYGECGWRGIDLCELEYLRAEGSRNAALSRLINLFKQKRIKTKQEMEYDTPARERRKRESPSINATQTGPRPVGKTWNWREHLRRFTPAQRRLLAKQRGLSEEAVMEAECRGLVFAIRSLEGWAWLVTDSQRETASWRRLDGSPWKGGTKAKYLTGSKTARIIGVEEALGYQEVVLVEGGPDLLAALHLWPDRGVMCALSANSQFGEQQLIEIGRTGMSVLIYPHRDDKGLRAAASWREQLRKRSRIVAKRVLPGIHKDLNDYVRAL